MPQMRLSRRKSNWLPIREDNAPDNGTELYLYVPPEVADYVALCRRDLNEPDPDRTPADRFPHLRKATPIR